MVALTATCGLVILLAGAEWFHHRRCRRLAPLAFGPTRRPAAWARAAPLLRIASLGAICWASITLILLPPKVHQAQSVPESETKHVVLVLDVSPSMRLEDAGPSGKQSRAQRASDVMESFFKRVVIQQYRLSVVAVYNGAMPVVIDTNDVEVVRNVLDKLPMHHAFEAGKTKLFSGLEEAARIAKPWKPKSTSLIVLSDGDTVPATNMPKMPAAVGTVVVVGVGDPVTGRFIDGRQSRQDTSSLRQIAARLNGTFHNGNENHLSTDLLRRMTQTMGRSKYEQLTLREYALICLGLGGFTFALLPVLLHYLGTTWNPGVPPQRVAQTQSPAAGNGSGGAVARQQVGST
jgi:Ca-activated chloride channel family protein